MITAIVKLFTFKIRRLFYPQGKEKLFTFHDIKLSINAHDVGGLQYNQRKSFEEISNPLYDIIEKDLTPKVFLDIGANYGFISIIASKKFKNAKLILVEPGENLNKYILKNLNQNNITNYEFIDAICGEENKSDIGFAQNPYSSQDNRVIAPKKVWKSNLKNMVSMNSILQTYDSSTAIFIKIDVQGFEEKVFEGGMKFLTEHNRWIVKTEFAPNWLTSQGTKPDVLLDLLIKHFDVIELPTKVAYQTKSINELFLNPLKKVEIDSFLKYVYEMDRDNRGWCDLLIRPKSI